MSEFGGEIEPEEDGEATPHDSFKKRHSDPPSPDLPSMGGELPPELGPQRKLMVLGDGDDDGDADDEDDPGTEGQKEPKSPARKRGETPPQMPAPIPQSASAT